MEKVTIKSQDDYLLSLHLFEVEDPKGYVQVIHGMEEHQERYEYLASKLNEEGYTVITSNMRGHGEDAPEQAFFKEKEGNKYLINDQIAITKYIKERFNAEKIILLAHSMGTIITRNLLQTESNDYQKIILLGFPCPQGAAGFGIFLANVTMLFKGPRYYSKMLHNMAVGSFNKNVKNPKSDVDWISYNEENVAKYIADPYCGVGFKVSALKDLFVLLKNMAKVKSYVNINADLPILMLNGQDDPCTGFEKGCQKSIALLQKAGFKDIKHISYEHMRHEILNEDDKLKVINDICSFL